MSKAVLFIFIEGYTDRYFYDKIVKSECNGPNINYELVTSQELQIGKEGKSALLKFFTYLKRKSSLIDTFKGKTTVSIFFLDKDVDDFLGTKRCSEHVVYTETYEVENYLFIYGEISEVAASSASLPISSITTGLGNYATWRKHAAESWKEWIKLCLFSCTHIHNPECNYSRKKSLINNDIYGSIDKSKHVSYLSKLQNNSGLPPDKFNRSFKRLSSEVDKIYSAEQHDLIFKGKWYACFLVEDIKRIAGTKRFNFKSLKDKLVSGLAYTLNFDDSWAEQFRAPIRKLLAEAGI